MQPSHDVHGGRSGLQERGRAHLRSRSLPRRGFSQVTSSQRRTPKEKMSATSLHFPPVSSSGAAYAKVPMPLRLLMCVVCTICASPTSAILALPSLHAHCEVRGSALKLLSHGGAVSLAKDLADRSATKRESYRNLRRE